MTLKRPLLYGLGANLLAASLLVGGVAIGRYSAPKPLQPLPNPSPSAHLIAEQPTSIQEQQYDMKYLYLLLKQKLIFLIEN